MLVREKQNINMRKLREFKKQLAVYYKLIKIVVEN